MRDMTNSCATISVATCYISRSKPQGAGDAETSLSHDKTRGARLAQRAAGHGAAGFAGPALDAAHRLGAARGSRADLAGVAHGLRRSLADRAERAAAGIARGGFRRSRRGRRLRAHAIGQGTVGAGDAAVSIRGEVGQAIVGETAQRARYAPSPRVRGEVKSYA